MIEITLSSIISGIFLSSVFILLFIIITNINAVISKIPMGFLILCIFIIILRLSILIEFNSYNKPISSFKIMPLVKEILYFQPNFLNLKLMVGKIFVIVWFLGAVICLFTYFKSQYLLCKKISYIQPTSDTKILKCLNNIKDEQNLKFNVFVILNKEIKVPAEFGYFKKVIFLPEYNYQDKELYYILLHELIHFDNKSNWIKLIIAIINAVFWWNPIIRLLKRHVDSLIELYVDMRITKSQNKQINIEYLTCIYNMYKFSVKSASFIPEFMNPLINSEERLLKKRFRIITRVKKTNYLLCISIFFILFTFIFNSYKYIILPGYEPPPEELQAPELNADNSYILKEEDGYNLYYNGKKFLYVADLNIFPDIPIIKELR